MTYEIAFEFYSNLKQALRASQIDFLQVGGQAAIEFKLAEFTKDIDLEVDVDKASEFIDCISLEHSRGAFRDYPLNYRYGLSAPLDARWGSVGLDFSL